MSQALKQLLCCTLFIVIWIHTGVLGQDQESRLDVLKGEDGENSCTLKANIYKGCLASPPSTFNATYETPATCTCNKVFFNIWSACSYSIGENLFPVFQDWMTTCSNSGISLPQAQFLADRNTWGVNAPNWARIDVPGNQTMDLQSAVLVVTQSKWSALQIALPFATALVAIIVTVLIMRRCNSGRLQKASWRDRALRLVRPIPRVTNVDKYDSWEIEANNGGQYELVAPQSSESDTYAFGPRPSQAQQRGGHSKTDSETLDSGWGSLKNLRFPWKNGPNRVQEVHATTEFDIDDHSVSSTTVGLTNDAESIYSQKKIAVNEGDASLPKAVPSIYGPPPVTNIRDPYGDPFVDQNSHR